MIKTIFKIVKAEIADKDFAKGAAVGSGVAVGVWAISSLPVTAIAIVGAGAWFGAKKMKVI